MSGDAKPRNEKRKRFYRLYDSPRYNASGREIINHAEVCRDSGAHILTPPSLFERGFRQYSIRPRFHVSKRLGRTPYDIEFYSGYLFVSERAKQVFDGLNQTDFTYLSVDTEFDTGFDPVNYWLCDVVSVLDAINEERSTVASEVRKDGLKFHKLMGSYSLAIDETIVGEHCAFRLKTAPPTVICNERFKAAVKKAGLTGLSFSDVFEPSFDRIGTVKSIIPAGTSWQGRITPQGSGKDIIFGPEALENSDKVPAVGQTVRVYGQRSRYGHHVATRVLQV